VILKQPEIRAISQEQLVATVKGIYASLVIVKRKNIEVDNNPSSLTIRTGALRTKSSRP
jgi:hypothetical protein